MAVKDKERLHPRIDRKLARLARSSVVPPAWHDVWSRLGPGSTGEERLKVCQAIRDSGDLPADAGYFLVSMGAEAITAAAEATLQGPLQTLNVFEGRKSSDRTFADLLDRYGEGAMATLVRGNPTEHARRRAAGRLLFVGPAEAAVTVDAARVASLLRLVADSLVAPRPIEALEFWHRLDYGSSEVHVRRPSPGDQGWAVDIERLREGFDSIDGIGWYAAPAGEDGGPYCWIEETFLDHDLFLRLLPDTPHTSESGEKYEVWRRG